MKDGKEFSCCNHEDTVMIPIKRELAEAVVDCCIESRCNPFKITNAAIDYAVNKYIENRNKDVATWTEEEVANEYPNIAEESIPKFLKLAAENKLGVPDPAWFYVPDEQESAPEVTVAKSDPDTPPDFSKVHVADVVEGEELLDALKEVCRSAHKVIINVHIINTNE